jgi:hypothetical protein
VIHVFVVEERAGLSHERINHVPKVDLLFVLSKQPWQSLQTLAAIPKFQMVLMDQYVEF